MIAAAVCPNPPLLAEPFDRSRVPELQPVRQAARSAVGALVASEPARIVVVAAGSVDEDETAGGDLAPWGVPVRAGGTRSVLGLAHTVGAWLLDDARWTGARAYVGTIDTVLPGDALLVMADGTTKRTLRAPGFLDERAEPFDRMIERALATGDAAALAGLDEHDAAELGAAGGPALVALGRTVRDGAWSVRAELLLAAAPLGVGYWIARWELSEPAS